MKKVLFTGTLIAGLITSGFTNPVSNSIYYKVNNNIAVSEDGRTNIINQDLYNKIEQLAAGSTNQSASYPYIDLKKSGTIYEPTNFVKIGDKLYSEFNGVNVDSDILTLGQKTDWSTIRPLGQDFSHIRSDCPKLDEKFGIDSVVVQDPKSGRNGYFVPEIVKFDGNMSLKNYEITAVVRLYTNKKLENPAQYRVVYNYRLDESHEFFKLDRFSGDVKVLPDNKECKEFGNGIRCQPKNPADAYTVVSVSYQSEKIR